MAKAQPDPLSEAIQASSQTSTRRKSELHALQISVRAWQQPGASHTSSKDVHHFWKRSTALIVADATDETEARVEQILGRLRADLASGREPQICLKNFHWKVLELGPASLAFSFQDAWKRSAPFFVFPESATAQGRCVLALRGLISATMLGSEDLANSVMIRYLDMLRCEPFSKDRGVVGQL
ncbi:hypothetical protein FNL55_01585 [Tardiphaga sp. vice352]|uniref:hypothetical protein n=1 Tax=Tardiphaga sp. vice352 TaxID=2592816 RepID=UPI001165599B|nr:hypothetical protein [Tardiphaga sp. vice352]QDM30177.1 hypothetical protein FNL55_01585 [Tardiphaga sp. vice352]